MNTNEIKKLYTALRGKGYSTYDLGDENAFETKMSDKTNRKELYDWVSSRGDFRMGDYEKYEERLTSPMQPEGTTTDPIRGISMAPVEQVEQTESVAQPQQEEDEYQPLSFGQKMLLKGMSRSAKNLGVRNNPAQAVIDADKEMRELEENRQQFMDETQLQEVRQANRQQVRDMIADIDSAMESVAPKSDFEGVPLAGPMGATMTAMRSTRGNADYNNYTTAKRSLSDASKIIEEADRHAADGTYGSWLETSFAGSAARGFGDKLFDVRTWDMGISDTMDNANLLQALNDFDEGKALSKSQQALLDAKAVELATQAYFGSYLGRGYKAGQVTAEAIPFMIEMAINPASAMGKSASNMMARYALKRFGKGVAEKALTAGARVAGDIAGASTMAATTGIGRVASDATERMAGQVQFATDEDNQSVFAGHTEGEDPATAVAKAFGSTTIENYSEMFGNYFSPILGGAGKMFRKGADKIGAGKVVKMLDDVAASDLARIVSDFEKNAQWSGTISEYAEEVAGGIMNAIFVGDQTLDTAEGTGVFNLDQNIDTFLGVALLGGAMSTVKTVGYPLEKYQANKRVSKADKAGLSAFHNAEAWNAVKEKISVDDIEQKAEALADIVLDKNITDEQKEAAFKYVEALQRRDGARMGEMKHNQDPTVSREQVEVEQSYDNGYTLETSQEMNDAKVQLDAQAENLRSTWGSDADQDIDEILGEDPYALIREVDDEQRGAIIDYLNAKATYDGMIQRVRDDIDGRIEANNANIDQRKNITTGMVVPATLKQDGKAVFVKSGNVVLNDDGSVNNQESSESIVVMDEAGHTEMIAPSAILSLGQTEEAEALKATQAQQIAEQYATMKGNQIDGVLPFAQGDTYNIMDEQGAQHSVQVVADNGDGSVQVAMDGATEAVMMPKEQIQTMSQAFNKARAVAYNEQKKAQEVAQQEPQAEQKAAEGQPAVEEAQVDQQMNEAEGNESQPRKLTSEEADVIISAMEANAAPAPEIELTPKNWVAEFGEDGIIETPIGKVKMGENQYFKLAQKGRESKLGMIKPTLESPDVIVEEKSSAKGGQVAERNSSYVFVKAFTNADGTRTYKFTSVTIRKDGREVVISNQEKETPRIKRLLREGMLTYISEATLPSEPTHSTQGDQQTIPSGATLSDSKDTTSEPKSQEVAQKNVTETAPVVQQPQIPLLKNGEPDYNAMDARMFAEQYVTRFGEGATERIARNNIKASNKTISTIEKQIEDVTDPNKMPALYSKLQEAQATKDKYSAVLEELGLSADESEDNAARIQRKKQENTPWFNKLFPDGFPNVESVILWDIANGNRIRWANKEVNGAVVSKGLGSHLGLADSNAERTRRVALIGKEAPTPEEYAEQLPERLNAMGIRFEESELLDTVIAVYTSVDTVRKAKEELEKISANIQAEQEGLDYEEEQMRRNYEREQEALRQETQPEVGAEQTEQEQPTNEESQEEELSIEDEVPFMISGNPLASETTESIMDSAKNEFEETDDWSLTGWLLPDGTQLSFSEEGGFERDIDHRAIGRAYSGSVDERWKYMQDFEQRGGIRVSMNYGSSSIELSVKPTPAQFSKLSSFVREAGGNVDIDFMDENYNTSHSVSYDSVKSSRVLSDIERYFDEGIKPSGNVSFEIAESRRKNKNEAQQLATEAAITALEDAGVEVVNATPEMVEEALRRNNAIWRKEKAPETAEQSKKTTIPTAISSASGAKVIKNLDILATEYEERPSNRARTFLGDVSGALEIPKSDKKSRYKVFEAVNGVVFAIRLSDHNATVKNFDDHNEDYGISIVVTGKPNTKITNDGKTNVVEFFYSEKELRKADGKPLAQIIRSIQQALFSGVYEDTTGLAEVEEVNDQFDIRAYHGSGAKFDAFDHSYMGTGEGAQAFGWGTYVSEVFGIGKRYAEERRRRNPYEYKLKNAETDYSLTAQTYKTAVEEMPERRQRVRELEAEYYTHTETLKELRSKYGEESPEYRNYLFYNEDWDDRIQQVRKSLAQGEEYLKHITQAFLDAAERLDSVRRLYDAAQGDVYLYEVSIPDDNSNNYLPWDDVVPDEVVDFLRNNLNENYGTNLGNNYFHTGYPKNGEYIYKSLSKLLNGDKAASEFLNKNGYVGIKYPSQYTTGGRKDGSSNYVIFNPSDVEIMHTTEFSIGPAPVFVSNAKIAVFGVKQEKATPEQWLKMIEKAGGLKAGEDKWLGLSDWLKASDKKTLTKQEVLDYINENQIQIEETTYSSNSAAETTPEFKALQEEFKQLVKSYEDEAQRNLDEYEEKLAKKYNFPENYFDTTVLNSDESKAHSSLSRAVGEAYNAAWVDLVDRYGDDFEIAFWRGHDGIRVDNAEAAGVLLGLPIDRPIYHIREDYTTNGLEGNREIALTVPTIEAWNENDEIHFGDAGEGRAIAWVRFGETTDEDGKRVLVIDEIQSKRHQEGREKGYRTKKQSFNVQEAEQNLRYAVKEFNDYRDQLKRKYDYESLGGSIVERSRNFMAALSEEERNEFKRLNEQKAKLERTLQAHREVEIGIDDITFTEHDGLIDASYGDYISTHMAGTAPAMMLQTLREQIRQDRIDNARRFDQLIPEAPFEKNWAELAMKRMLRYATENGYDAIAWTKGNQQAERYGLRQTVEQIIVADNNIEELYDGTPIVKDAALIMQRGVDYNLKVDENGVIRSTSFSGKTLSDVVGKSLAERIMQQGDFVLKNEDLAIGGEGMRAFYDQMLPSFMRKYGKKWGATVQDVTLPYVEEAGRTMHSVDVTDSMRESVMQGQPMFYRRPNGTVYGWTNGTTVYLTESGMNPNTPIHEYTHIWADAMRKHNPEGWKSILKLLKGTPVWNEVMADANYANIHSNENQVASEALSRISGRENSAKMEAMAQQMIDENANDTVKKNRARKLLDRMRKALQEFWSWVGKELFGIKNFESIEQVTDRILYDLVSGTDLNPVSSFDTSAAERAEEVASNAQKIADKFGLSNEIVVAETQEVFVNELQSENVADELIKPDAIAVFTPSGRIMVNATMISEMAELPDSIMHEFAHNVTHIGSVLYRLQDTVLEVGEERFEVAGREIFGQTADPLEVADEIIATFVGNAANPNLYDGEDLVSRVFAGYSTEEAIRELLGSLPPDLYNGYADVVEAVMPYVKEVLDAIKTNHDGPRKRTRASEDYRDAQAETGRVRISVQGYSGSEEAETNRFDNEANAMRGAETSAHTKETRTQNEYNRTQVRQRSGSVRQSDGVDGGRGDSRRDLTALRESANELASQLNTPIRIVEDVNTITDNNAKLQERKRNAKGFYDRNTNEVVVVLPNATSVEDVRETIFHEVVGHKGLQALVGKERFNAFLDKVYANANEEVRRRIALRAAKLGWDFHEATEEYIAELAEQGFEERENRNFFEVVRDFFLDMLRRAKIALGYNISDNDLRYMLWRTYQMQRSKGAMAVAEDIVMQQKLGVGNFRARQVSEEEQIATKAKKNGSYLKAPNGKDTNLTPEQWVTVRTKAFKRWFGDWEKAARIEKLRTSESASIVGNEIESSDDMKQYRKNALEYGKSLRGEYRNADTDRTIIINRDSLTEVLHHDGNNVAHIQSIAAIPQMVERGIFITSEPVYADASEKLKNAKEVQYYVCGLNIGGVPYTVKFVVAEYENGERYYDHSLTQIEKGDLLNRAELSSTVADSKSPISGIKDKRLVSILQTNSSKILDANGEPLVVEHSTWNEDFYTFDISKLGESSGDKGIYGSGFYFGNVGETEMYGDRVIRSYLSVKNPLILPEGDILQFFDYLVDNFDKEGLRDIVVTNSGKSSTMGEVIDAIKEVKANYGRGEYNELIQAMMQYWTPSSAADRVIEQTIFRKVGFAFYRSLTPFIERNIGQIEFSEALRNAGYDGVIYDNHEYVAFYPNQIKLADGSNTTFASDNNDIRFRDGSSTPAPKKPKFKPTKLSSDGIATGVRAEYEKLTKTDSYQSREALQDGMLSLRRYQEMATKAHGKTEDDIKDWENAYMAENQLSSRNDAEIRAFDRTQRKELEGAVSTLMKKGFSYEEINDYMMLKHGIERNREQAVRRAISDKEGKVDAEKLAKWKKAKQSVSNDSSLDSWEKEQRALDKIAEEKFKADLYERDYSGLTAMHPDAKGKVKDAVEMSYDEVNAFEQKGELVNTNALWKAVRASTMYAMNKMRRSSLISKETMDDIVDMYSYYVPLRGFDETTSDEVYGYMNNEPKAFNAPIRKAKGRATKADAVLPYIVSAAHSAIMQGNRNVFKLRFLNFVEHYPTDLVTKEKMWVEYDKSKDEWIAKFPDLKETDSAEDVARKREEFEAKMKKLSEEHPESVKEVKQSIKVPYRVLPQYLQQHQIIVKRNGVDVVLTVNGSPRLAMAINGIAGKQAIGDKIIGGAVGRGAEKATRYLSGIYTQYNPDFMISNFFRDVIYTNTMVWLKESPRYALKFHQNMAICNPFVMIKLFHKLENGTLDMSNELEREFNDFIMNGGETGYAKLASIEELKKDIARTLDPSMLDNALELAKKLSAVNRAVENVARFAAYRTSRQLGRSITRSVNDAKEISVNFNRKGAGDFFYGAKDQTTLGKAVAAGAGIARPFYAFFNASMQGLANVAKIAKRKPVATGTLGAGLFILGALLASMAGDDEEEYYNLPEYVRRQNIVFKLSDGTWASIPLPIEYRAIYGLGEMIVSVVRGKEDFSDHGLAYKVAEQLAQVLPINVLEGKGGLGTLVPTLAAPVVEVLANEDWAGIPIYRKDNPFTNQHTIPEYQRVYSKTGKGYVAMSKFFNDITGGDEVKRGFVQINPAVVEHLVDGYLGGPAQFLNKVASSAEMVAGAKEFDWRSVPFANRLVKTSNPNTRNKAINNLYFKNVEDAEDLASVEKGYSKIVENEDETPEKRAEYAEKLDKLHESEEWKKAEQFLELRNEVDDMRKIEGVPEEYISNLKAEANEIYK